MKLRQYSEYKKSDFEWLGIIPDGWKEKPGLCAFREKKVKNVGNKETQVLSLSYGRIVIKPPEKLHGLVPESFETYQIVDKGDIIIRGTDLQNDKVSLRVGQVKNRGIITSAYLCLKARGCLFPDYVYWLLHAYDLMKYFYGFGSGLRQNLDYKDFKRLIVPVPPENDQRKIVKYLDATCTRITKFIRNKRRLIQLLKEQKQAIINQAVTQGIDANVKKKPSGVDLLGNIPVHWGVKRLRTMARVMPSGVDKHIIEGEIPIKLCNYVDVYKNDRILDSFDFMKGTATSAEIQKFKLRGGDVLVTKDSESWDDIAVPSFVPEAINGVICAYHLAIVRAYGIDGEYLFWAFLSEKVADQFRVSAKGVTRYGLAQGAIKYAWFPVPPKKEQLSIVEHINQCLSKNYLVLSQEKLPIIKRKLHLLNNI